MINFRNTQNLDTTPTRNILKLARLDWLGVKWKRLWVLIESYHCQLHGAAFDFGNRRLYTRFSCISFPPRKYKVNFALGVSELLDGVYKLSILHTVFVLVFKLSIELMQIIHQWNTMKNLQNFIWNIFRKFSWFRSSLKYKYGSIFSFDFQYDFDVFYI
jgi:hypothetical protein